MIYAWIFGTGRRLSLVASQILSRDFVVFWMLIDVYLDLQEVSNGDCSGIPT